jgi:putative endonuclease
MKLQASHVMCYYVYILESLADSRWYYGYSEHLPQRVSDHNTNRSKYTRRKGPWRLIFVREFDDKTAALQFELYLKRTRNKEYIRKEFAPYFLPPG